jgi:hypothetical protein
VAHALGVRDEIDEPRLIIDAVWRSGAAFIEIVTPQPKRPPGSQLTRDQADHVGALAWLADEFEVMQPYLSERQIGRFHLSSRSREAHF